MDDLGILLCGHNNVPGIANSSLLQLSKSIRFFSGRAIQFLTEDGLDQTKNNDFKPFGAAMTKISKRQIDKSYEIYLCLYQAVTGKLESPWGRQ